MMDRQQSLDRLLTQDLDEAAQVDCLRQLTLADLDADFVADAVTLFRDRMIAVDTADPTLVDLCGTGGDHSGSFNISTTASFVVAGAGYRVAKHGNVSATSKSGSIDMLRALGIPIPETPGGALEQLNRAGIMFLFAPYYHPLFAKFAAARRVMAVRGERTIFNLLGPLLNPASVKRAAMGVFSKDMVYLCAHALHLTGTQKALVFNGDGMDELSLTGSNVICEISHSGIITHIWDAATFGMAPCVKDDLAGGTAEDNAALAYDILCDHLAGPKKDMVILNAGAAIYAANDDISLIQCIAKARDSIDSGAALDVLERLKA